MSISNLADTLFARTLIRSRRRRRRDRRMRERPRRASVLYSRTRCQQRTRQTSMYTYRLRTSSHLQFIFTRVYQHKVGSTQMSQYTTGASGRRSRGNTSVTERQRRRSSSANRRRHLPRTGRNQVVGLRNRGAAHRTARNSTSTRRTNPRDHHNLVSTLTGHRMTADPRRNHLLRYTVTRRRRRSFFNTAGNRRASRAGQFTDFVVNHSIKFTKGFTHLCLKALLPR